MKRTLPDHLKMTMPQFRAMKRRELRALLEAASDFAFAAAYLPEPQRWVRIRQELAALEKSLSVEAWGR